MTPNPHDGARFETKTRQLCAQVAYALTFALSDAEDELLRDLELVAVTPTVDTGELLVAVRDHHGHGAEVVLDALEEANGYLRSVVATEIHRRRVPRLRFTVVPAT